MMRCEHVVEKKRLKLEIVDGRITRRTRPRPCRHELKSVSRKLVIGNRRWHVYRCRFRHETHIYVGPAYRVEFRWDTTGETLVE